MSTVLPSDNAELLRFGNDHAPVFTLNAVAIGLTVPIASAFSASNKSMQDSWLEFNDAKAALRKASDSWKDARAAFRTLAGQDVTLIKNFAERQANPAATYALAQIPAPSPRNPGIPPNSPTDLRATLDTQTGELIVRWNASQPKSVTGVVYNIQRVVGTGTSFASAGLSGSKSFTDDNIPAGTSRIQYRVIAQRGSLTSPASTTLDVRFSTNAQGEVQIASVKMAA
jgi:hypothetical protein